MKQETKKKGFTIFACIAAFVTGIAIYINKKEQKKLGKSNQAKLTAKREQSVYEKYIKRALDIVLALAGILLLWPVMLLSALVVWLEDPANPIFEQKRVGIDQSYFTIHKLRSMKVNTKDIPTHLLTQEEQDALILKSGRIFRKLSIDELPQCFDILRGRMSVVGPRPALWNQEDLIAEREKYGANSVKPGLTGWAQIHGRDELEIDQKALLDGYYTKQLKKSSWSGFIIDMKCFFGTFSSVLSSKGVVEGGTGNKEKVGDHRPQYTLHASNTQLIGQIGFDQPVRLEPDLKKKILITGQNSYIGENFRRYAKENYPDNFEIDTLDLLDENWSNVSFEGYDVIYHVAGIAHSDVGNVSETVKQTYYDVNTKLAVAVAKKAKKEHVSEFIYMSSMIVYGDSAPYGKEKMIDQYVIPKPANFYGDSKLQADVAVRSMADGQFSVIVLRPPMIYGRDCKGNYPLLAKLAKKMPLFPMVDNARSMLYIENLCEFLCQILLVPKRYFSACGNVFFPQNRTYTDTSQLVELIAKEAGHTIHMCRWMKPFVQIGSSLPCKIGQLVNKAFGNNCYDFRLSQYPGIAYQKMNLTETVHQTENNYPVHCVQKIDPLVSIITVSYNSEKTIRQTIESVLNQTYTNLEYWIVDGCSADQTIAIAQSYEKEFERRGISYHIVSEPDHGIYDAMNKGIFHAAGEIVGIINSDDWYENNAVETMVKTYQNTGFDYYYADVRLHRADGSQMVKHSKKDRIVTSRHWNHPTCFVTKKTYEELGAFRNQGIHDDFDFFLRVRKAGKKIVIENRVLANFRTGGASNDKTLKKCVKRCKDRFQCYQDNGYSALYLIECVAIELVKALIS